MAKVQSLLTPREAAWDVECQLPDDQAMRYLARERR